jgi:hypothetical protein
MVLAATLAVGMGASVTASATAKPKSKTTTTTKPKPKPKVAALTCAKTHAYPGHQPADCVAVNNAVAIANTTVTALWAVQPNPLGGNEICTTVKVKNHNSSTITYNDLYWTLQTPSGEVVNTNFQASPDLGSGSIVGGGTASGQVCFDDPGQTGKYVGIYKPDPFSAARGIWLFTGT